MPEDELRRRIDAFRNFVHQMQIRVLVWGPGPPPSGSSSPGYNKRLQIRNEIIKNFPRANVYFSEDPEMMAITQHLTDQLLREALQAKAVDVVIILGMTRGAQVEIDHFLETYPWFPGKAYVFLPEKYANSVGLGIGVLRRLPQGHVITYTQEEFDRCDLATLMAVKAVEQAATAIYLSGSI